MKSSLGAAVSGRTIYLICLALFAAFCASGCSGSSGGGGASESAVLTAIAADKYEDTLEISARYDFSRISVRALYSSGEVRSVTPKWFSGGSEIDTAAFYAPAAEAKVPLIAQYSEGLSSKTLEVVLNAVKAHTAAYFSVSSDMPGPTAEVFLNYDSPVFKIVIGSPTTEALIVKKLSFAVTPESDGGSINGAAVSDGVNSWRPSAIAGRTVEFNFSGPRLRIAANSVAEITLALNLNKFPDAAEGEPAPCVLLSSEPGGIEIYGEFFGTKVMENISGLPLRSNPMAVSAPPAVQERIEELKAGESYSAAAVNFDPGAPVVLGLEKFDASLETLAFIVSNASGSAGAYSLKTGDRPSVPAAYNAASGGFFPAAGFPGGPAAEYIYDPHAFSISGPEPADGQTAADGRMREMEADLIKRLPAPVYSAPGTPAPRAASGYKTGDLENFQVVNVKTFQWQSVTAEVTAVGARCYVFEEAGMPERYRRLTKERAEEVASRFDNDIYSKVTGVFGGAPDPGIDGDPKIFILFTRVVNEGTALGYFSAMNQYKRYNEQGVEQFRYSNEKEMIFSAVRDSESEFTDEDGFFTLLFNVISHEFQHMINWHQHSLNNGYEETWVNEGLSMLAEDIAGYGYQKNFYARRVAEFFNDAGSYSLDNFKYLNRGSYGYSYLFFRYLYDRGAVPENMVKSVKNGKANVEAEIIRAGIAPDFRGAFEDFLITLYFASEGLKLDDRYSYRELNLKGAFNFAGALNVNINGIADSAKISAPALFSSRQINGCGFNILRYNPAAGADAVNFYLMNKGTGGLKITPVRYRK